MIVYAQCIRAELALQASGGGLGQGDCFEQIPLLGGDSGEAGGGLALMQRELVLLDPAGDVQGALGGDLSRKLDVSADSELDDLDEDGPATSGK